MTDRRRGDGRRRSRDSTRRQFLRQASSLAGGLAAIGAAGAAARPEEPPAAEPLPTVALGKHRVTRLILGGNPIYGYSHFNGLYSQHLRDYHTPERVVDLVRASVRAGITTWQNSYDPRTLDDIQRARSAGVKFDWLLLGKPDWDKKPEVVDQVAKLGPIGIAPHGSLGERLHREGRTAELLDLLKRIRQAGVLVGLSAHDPKLLELSEERGWDVDYYMASLHYLTRPREELRKLLGEVPVGAPEVYLESDRRRMLDVVAKAKHPCLVYKVLAAGRLDLSAGGIRRAFEEVLQAIKPTDAMIVGMFQEFGDQVGANAKAVREICAGLARKA